MVARRAFLKSLPLAGVALATWLAAQGEAADPPAFGGKGLAKGLDLQKQLEKGLKAQRPSDFTYIKMIVNKVDNGTLPLMLVEQSFLFARQEDGVYPFIYFQFALKKLASRAGVAL